jgi:fibro-slime domain-containing protein
VAISGHAGYRAMWATLCLHGCVAPEHSAASVKSGSSSSSASSESSISAGAGGLLPPNTGSSNDGGGGNDPFVDGGVTPTLNVTIRDFKMYSQGGTNPDFENELGDDRGIVETALGADQKPVYAHGAGPTATTHGQTYFDQWYRDTPGVNIDVQYPLTLTRMATGIYGYDSAVSGPNGGWFPIDDNTPYATAFGNQGQPHNYSFTTELHTVFTYNGGETFSFSGDDDVFVFINGQLVIDLGGVHSREQQSISLDTLTLTAGQQYPLDLFNAERHTVSSNFSFSTTLALRAPPPR